MKVLISGSSGLIGAALLDCLCRQGSQPVRLVRPSSRNVTPPHLAALQTVVWDPAAGRLAPEASGAEAVVHLAGASIAEARWTPSRKRLLEQSRIAATRALVDSLSRLPQPPRIFLAASAIGYYGSRGEETLTESSGPGNDFLARLCLAWEAESIRAAQFARVAVLRFGVILARHGGALPRMALPFRIGLGGRIGSGRQWMSWIALGDAVNAILFVLTNDALSGPINVVAPQPVQNAQFTSALARVLRRPAIVPVPAFALRLVLGELTDALLLCSQRVLPERLSQSGYTFESPSLEPALSRILGS